jgi:hypothetical protein
MGYKAYAFDINTSSNIWTTSLGRPFRPDPHDAVDVHHINTSFGVLSTPVIDRDVIVSRHPSSHLLPCDGVEGHDPAMMGMCRIRVVGRLVGAGEADVEELVVGRTFRKTKRS